MKNKKGFELLGNHTVNIIIAVLCLIVLIYLGYKVFGLFQNKGDLEKAEANLQNFAAEFDNFMKSSEKEKEFIILGPEDWYVKFFDGGFMPDKCTEYNYCACFCNGDAVKKCDERGTCLELKNKWEWEGSYEIEEVPYTIKIEKNEQQI